MLDLLKVMPTVLITTFITAAGLTWDGVSPLRQAVPLRLQDVSLGPLLRLAHLPVSLNLPVHLISASMKSASPQKLCRGCWLAIQCKIPPYNLLSSANRPKLELTCRDIVSKENTQQLKLLICICLYICCEADSCKRKQDAAALARHICLSSLSLRLMQSCIKRD